MANEIKEPTFQYEHQFQAHCYAWFHNTFSSLRKMLFSVNNNSSSRMEGNKQKALGVVAGVSDFIFIGEFFVAFIELKLPGKSQGPEQIQFELMVTERGHAYYIVDTFSKFKALVYKLIEMNK